MRADMERFAIDSLIGDGARQDMSGSLPPFLVQVPDLASVDAHWHDYYELGYVLDGEAQHVVNGVPERLRAGSAFLLSPVDFHEITVAGPARLRCVNVVMHPSFAEDALESVIPTGDEWLPWVTSDLTDAAGDITRVCAEVTTRGPGWRAVVEAALRTLLVEMARRCSPAVGPATPAPAEAGPQGGVPPNVRAAVRFVERHFREPLTLAQVAAVAHLSPHWFSEQFRVATGSPFQVYLKNRRLQFARALLDATALPVTDVCHAAGFNDPSYFGRAYRSRYGDTPSAGRR
jgi:AraC-like DNA-binding protein/mannose-6-phosphate isomerase-like protein (cupin superfamily)